MKTKETNMKRLTFKGVINADQEKLPQKSRSKSRNNTKASSYSPVANQTANGSFQSIKPSNKVEPRSTFQGSKPRATSKQSNNESIFRANKKNMEQQLMKQIIKLKNSTFKLQNTLKQASQHETSLITENKQNASDNHRLEEMQDYLQSFDAQIKKQAKSIDDSFMKKMDQIDRELQENQPKIPEFHPLTIAPISLQMPLLQSKLNQISERWLKN